MNIVQNGQNAVIKWDDFSIGANAEVNFSSNAKGLDGNFNVLNYVDSGKVSQIYGGINAKEGNVFVVNTAGAIIGKSAQINVGSLYVSNKKMDNEQLKAFYTGEANPTINGSVTGAEIMSLGNINANKVTFDGDRIVLDINRLVTNGEQMVAGNIIVNTSNKDNIVLGYDAYDEEKGYEYTDEDEDTYKNNKNTVIATVNGVSFTKENGYMWVKTLDQLQAMKTNLAGNYALNDSIDAIPTNEWNGGKGFKSIGSIGEEENPFTGKFDGLDYNIFGLTINRDEEENVGLFGYTDGATINNVTLVAGNITGGDNVGSVVGYAKNTNISNVTNSVEVSGNSNVGGVVGKFESEDGSNELKNIVNIGVTKGYASVGGIAGNMNGGKLTGQSYNLGAVTGIDKKGVNSQLDDYSHDIGGLVGSAANAQLGDGKTQIFNQLNITGGYNVGGIAGRINDEKGKAASSIKNAVNNGDVLAVGYTMGEYKYQTSNQNVLGFGTTENTAMEGEKTVNVYVANAGGIAGSVEGWSDNKIEIQNVQNNGDVKTETKNEQNKENESVTYDYYIAGNVGGVVGSANNANIKDAKNVENNIRGAHNVGGIAGYFENGKVDGALNDGGDIMGTGARNDEGWVIETLRSNVEHNNNAGDNEKFNVGNIGGIVGYLYEREEEQTTVSNSGNRGNVHSDKVSGNIISEKDIADSAKASNVGGIVGKINAQVKSDLSDIKKNAGKASVSNSYNTGKIQGYTGVGGVVGSMWNGAVTYSYNIGDIISSRKAKDDASGGRNTALNMGGIVGDTTEQTHARAVIYNVFNKGTIGDPDFKLSGRHVGGIVGRLSGYVDTSFNNGNIYNSHGIVGGIAGYFVSGGISNVFNTGNIVVNRSPDGAGSAVGGLVGDASGYFVGKEEKNQLSIENAYNLGVVRGQKYVAGIIASTNDHSKTQWTLSLKNVYTTGNIWANDNSGYIIAKHDGGAEKKVSENVVYMPPDGIFEYLHKQKNPNSSYGDNLAYDSNKKASWESFINNSKKEENDPEIWRIYDGTTPILNVFKPGTMTSDYFGKDKYEDYGNFSDDVQYGTAYDPFLTIIKANENINVDWNAAGFGIAEGLVVNGAGVSITNFGQKTDSTAVKDVLPYGGIIYSDGLTSISSSDGNNIFLGSAAKIYGSAVKINSSGDLIINGLVQSTGIENAKLDNTDNTTIKNGDVALSGNNVTVYGEIKSAQTGENIVINGIEKKYIEDLYSYGKGNYIDKTTYLVKYIAEHLGTDSDRIADYVKNKENEMPTISDYLAKTVESKADGDITITANNVKVLFGNEETGFVNAGGNLTVSGNDVYMDSDLLVGGNLTINGNTSVLDISNIGKVQTDKGLIDNEFGNDVKDLTDDQKALIGLHKFLDHFQGVEKNSISIDSSDAMITVDLWGDGAFDLSKFDLNDGLANILAKDKGHTLSEDLQKLNLTINGTGNTGNDEGAVSRKYVHIWVSDGEQLKGIQEQVLELAKDDQDQSKVQDFLEGNFALKNDIDASAVDDYKSIGEGVEGGFTGKFDGRGNRIIGLNIEGGAGIFNKICEGGSVDDVKIYSSNVSGAGNVGMVAGTNSGSITNITTFGNSVAVSGTVSGMAGGIVGNNNGSITNVSSTSIVESTSQEDAAFHLGGIAGVNEGAALIKNSESNSALTITADSSENTGSIGGIVGTNKGELNQVSSSGIISGLYKHRGNGKELYHVASHVGGIAGINSGTIEEAYNDSIVAGMLYVGGVVGKNTGEITNIANATYVYGGENVGGIVGYNDGTITDGRNNGAIFGAKGIEADKEIYRDDDIDKEFLVFTSTGKNIGGLVGYSGTNGKMSNLVNDMSASITGYENVGGIIGENHGVLTDSQNLMNKGTISGVTDVGGIIGENYGIVANINNQNTFDIVINKAYGSSNDDYKYFGGIVGHNVKDGIVYNVSNSGNVKVDEAQYVGGVIGQNDGIVLGTLANSGNVEGESNVGGIIGINNNSIDATSISTDVITYLDDKGIKVDNGKVVLINGAKVKVDENGQAKFTEFVLHGNTVSGQNSVGGVIGENTGNITNSDVINSVVAKVQGENNVGGIIGVNSGEVAGSRDEDDLYYANHVYNNGSVSGDENIGGLIGLNETASKLDAAYNTGTVEGKVNVGGIAGTNSGTISQVFNNVMIDTKDNEQKYTVGSVKGDTNVGGLVGVNNGNLQKAYNSSNVNSANGGNIVGTNSGVISGVYDAYNHDGKFVNQNNNGTIENSYSVSQYDKNQGVTILSGEKAKDSYYYEDGFLGKDENGENKTWKFYDGLTNPLLKVFLTKATYEGFDGTFNADNFKGEDGNNAFDQNDWLVKVGEYKYNYYLYSQQIIGSYYEDGNFNPNNLGYDLDAVFSAPKQPSFWEAEDKYAWTWDKKREDRERKAELHFVSGGMEL